MRFLVAVPVLVLLLAGCAAPVVEDDSPDETLPAGCADLSLELEQRKETTDAVDIVATNDGDRACTLSGYPAVEVLSTTGDAIGVAPEVSTDTTIEAVTIEPGGSAYALVEFDRGEADCETADTGGLRVTLPESDDPVVLDEVTVLFCPAGDRVLAGSFRSQPLEGQELQPGEDG